MRKKKWAALLAAVAVLAAALCGCGASASSVEAASAAASSEEAQWFNVTFTDDLGRELTVERPQKAAVLIGSFADIWCSAGGKDSMVATASDAWTEFDLGLPEDVVNLGSVKDPSAEALLACEPDFVLASTNTSADLELQPILEAAGIPVAYFGVSSVEDYLRLLEICTLLTGHPENYQEYGAKVREEVEAARQTAAAHAEERQTVLYLRASSSSVVVKSSEGNVLGEMLADLGCVNIADSETSLLENLSMEAILAADPDKIFFVLQGADPEKARASLESTVLSDPAWQQLTAVQAGECYYMDPHLYNLKPNARWGEAYRGLVKILYGEE